MEENIKENDYKLLGTKGMGPVAWAIFSVVVVVILVTGGYLFVRSKRDAKTEKSNSESVATSEVLGVESTEEMLKGKNAVVVTDSLAGNSSLIVNTAKLEEKGYVVILENDNGKPGKVIGQSSLLSKGEKKLIVITLNRATKSGETLYAVLYKDDGSEKYEVEKDEPIKSNNKSVAMRFKVL